MCNEMLQRQNGDFLKLFFVHLKSCRFHFHIALISKGKIPKSKTLKKKRKEKKITYFKTFFSGGNGFTPCQIYTVCIHAIACHQKGLLCHVTWQTVIKKSKGEGIESSPNISLPSRGISWTILEMFAKL